MMSSVDRFAKGDPKRFVIEGIDNLPRSETRYAENYADPIENTYGASVSETFGKVAALIDDSEDPLALLGAISENNIHTAESYDRLLFGEERRHTVLLQDVIEAIDVSVDNCRCKKNVSAAKTTTKKGRADAYLPSTEYESNDVYMAKSLSSGTKVKIAWGLDDDNEVVLVDEYDKWERIFGWKKLKDLPHGSRKIREELGDQLSDDLLDEIAPVADSDSQSGYSSSSGKTTRSRTKPSDEVLNVSVSRKKRGRKKIEAKEIDERLSNGKPINQFKDIRMLVLFPTTADRNLSDHWWVAGSRWSDGGGNVAIATCNKSTYQYLADHDEVWHIDEYIDQALDYTFDALMPTGSIGEVSINQIEAGNFVAHVLSEDALDKFTKPSVYKRMPEALNRYRAERASHLDLPNTSEMVYAPLSEEDAFWLKPVFNRYQNLATICCGETTSYNAVESTDISSDLKLYARARLPDWDFESPELYNVERSMRFRFDKAGYEMIETLGKIHDMGEQPYSQSPESRWDR